MTALTEIVRILDDRCHHPLDARSEEAEPVCNLHRERHTVIQ